jgi:hypothetical protein
VLGLDDIRRRLQSEAERQRAEVKELEAKADELDLCNITHSILFETDQSNAIIWRITIFIRNHHSLGYQTHADRYG